MRVALVEA